jgi:hypothetical protein
MIKIKELKDQILELLKKYQMYLGLFLITVGSYLLAAAPSYDAVYGYVILICFIFGFGLFTISIENLGGNNEEM